MNSKQGLSLADDSAKLFLHQENGHYVAHFQDVERPKLLRLVARGLRMENRFCGQLMRACSVLEHVTWLSSYLRRIGNYTASYHAHLHDTAEAFIRDIPDPIKTAQDYDKEAAVYKALNWKPLFSEYDPKVMNHWDDIAAIAEAKLFGWNWNWIGHEISSLERPEDVEEYICHVQNTLNRSYHYNRHTRLDDYEHEWIDRLNLIEELEKGGDLNEEDLRFVWKKKQL